ncbi:UNVERIFIED_CONTAM: flagellar motility protein MotE (MotC chaperone) [Acetivibrio alkalicellulosi]
MAKGKKELNDLENENNEESKKSKRGLLFGVFAFLTALAIIAVAFGGVFYIIIRNNINGLAENHRNDIKRIPILNKALPPPPIEYDPYDPVNLNEKELLEMYSEFRRKNSEINKELEEAEKVIIQLREIEDKYEKLQNEYEIIKNDLDSQRARLKEKEMLVDELIASGDKEGFKDYFIRIDKENAEKIYMELLREQKIDEDAREFAKIYENMDAGATAKIFEQLGTINVDLVVNTLKDMNTKKAAEVLEEMDEAYAAIVTEKLSKEFGIIIPFN